MWISSRNAAVLFKILKTSGLSEEETASTLAYLKQKDLLGSSFIVTSSIGFLDVSAKEWLLNLSFIIKSGLKLARLSSAEDLFRNALIWLLSLNWACGGFLSFYCINSWSPAADADRNGTKPVTGGTAFACLEAESYYKALMEELAKVSFFVIFCLNRDWYEVLLLWAALDWLYRFTGFEKLGLS